MANKLWIDDVRSPPDHTWHWVKTSSDAIHEILCSIYAGMVYREISFDHDLGGDDTAYRVATFLEEFAEKGHIARVQWNIHSANPVGRARLQAALTSADKFWTRNEELEETDPFWFERTERDQ